MWMPITKIETNACALRSPSVCKSVQAQKATIHVLRCLSAISTQFGLQLLKQRVNDMSGARTDADNGAQPFVSQLLGVKRRATLK